MQNKPLTIFGDGEQTRAFCYVTDVVDANIRAVESENIKGGEVINIGQKESYSINYLSKLVGGNVEYLPKRAGDALNTQADIILGKELLDWQPKTDFDIGVQKTKEWFRNSIAFKK